MLSICELRDLGYQDNPFTWCNNREDEHRISERLDRFLANDQWCEMYPNSQASHCLAAHSNHCPVVLDTSVVQSQSRGYRPFRFEIMWVGEKTCVDTIEQVWSQGSSRDKMGAIMDRILKCGVRLKQWNKSRFGNVQKRLGANFEQLKQAQGVCPS